MHILWNIFFFRYFTKNKEQRGIIFKILFCYFLGTDIIFEFFHNSCKKEFSKDFLSKSDSGLTSKLSQIFIILMEISLWPCTLFTSSELVMFDISSKLQSIQCSLDCVRTCWLVRRTLSFFKGVFRKEFAFDYISVTNIC